MLLVCLGVAAAFVARSGAGEAAPTAAAAVVSARPKATASPGTSGRAGAEPGGKASGGAGRAVPSVKTGAGTWKADGMRSALAGSGVSWFSTWAARPNGVQAPGGVEYVPMIWGADSATDATLADAERNGTVLLGFNEPR